MGGMGLAHLFQEEPDCKQGSEQKECAEEIRSSVWVILKELHPTKEVWVTPSGVRQKPPEGRSNDDSYVERHWQEQEGSGLVSLGPLANWYTKEDILRLRSMGQHGLLLFSDDFADPVGPHPARLACTPLSQDRIVNLL